jgi:hypothetical protein
MAFQWVKENDLPGFKTCYKDTQPDITHIQEALADL